MQLDLNSLASVRAFASAWAARPTPCLHALVNNAGIFDMGSTSRGLTADGHEAHWGTNYLAPALLSLLMLPHLRSAEPGAAKAGAGFAPRVVFVSSKLHQLGCVDLSNPSFAPSAPSAAAASAASASAASGRQRPSSRPYSALAGYAQSKLAEVRRGGGGRGPRGLTSPPTDGKEPRTNPRRSCSAPSWSGGFRPAAACEPSPCTLATSWRGFPQTQTHGPGGCAGCPAPWVLAARGARRRGGAASRPPGNPAADRGRAHAPPLAAKAVPLRHDGSAAVARPGGFARPGARHKTQRQGSQRQGFSLETRLRGRRPSGRS